MVFTQSMELIYMTSRANRHHGNIIDHLGFSYMEPFLKPNKSSWKTRILGEGEGNETQVMTPTQIVLRASRTRTNRYVQKAKARDILFFT